MAVPRLGTAGAATRPAVSRTRRVVVSGGCHHPVMPISREHARSPHADLTQNAMVPLDPDELLRQPDLPSHGYVFFGAIEVRRYEHKAPWAYDERDIRRVGQALAQLRLAPDDGAAAKLPAYRDNRHRAPEDRYPGWRQQLVSWMFAQTRYKALDGHPYEERDDSRRKAGANGLPGDLTCGKFVAAGSRFRHTQNHLSTRPLQPLTWSGKRSRLPRACTGLLDRAGRREEEIRSTGPESAAPATPRARAGAAGGRRPNPAEPPGARPAPDRSSARTPATCTVSGTTRIAGAARDATSSCAGCTRRHRPRRDGITATTTATSEGRSAAAATPTRTKVTRTASSRRKVAFCHSWNAAGASTSRHCRAGTTPPCSAPTWSRSSATAAASSNTRARSTSCTACTAANCAAGQRPTRRRKTSRCPRRPCSRRPSSMRRSPRSKVSRPPALHRAQGDRRVAPSLSTASRAGTTAPRKHERP